MRYLCFWWFVFCVLFVLWNVCVFGLYLCFVQSVFCACFSYVVFCAYLCFMFSNPDLSQELIKNPRSISWTGARFRMELYRAPGLRFVPNTFVCTVVRINEPFFPIVRECFRVDGIAMVLRSDKTSPYLNLS